MAEKKKSAATAAEDAPAETVATNAPVTTATPATSSADTSPRFGRGILIGAVAAALVTGLALGGLGGFAIAHAFHRPVAAQLGGGPGQQGPGQLGPGPQGPGQGGPGQGGPGQGGPGQQGPGQGGPQNQQQDSDESQDDSTDD
ncbi:MAG: hypothetical protein R2717_05870 [Schumannella sp.]